MNRENMIGYILEWEGNICGMEDKLDAMTDSELAKYYEDLYTEFQGLLPPPDPSELDPLDYGHLIF